MLSAVLYKLKSVVTCDFLGSFQPTEGLGLPGYFTLKLRLIFLKDFNVTERCDEDQGQFCKRRMVWMKPEDDSIMTPGQFRISEEVLQTTCERGPDRQSVPFTFRLAADLALAAWKDTSPVISSWQL